MNRRPSHVNVVLTQPRRVLERRRQSHGFAPFCVTPNPQLGATVNDFALRWLRLRRRWRWHTRELYGHVTPPATSRRLSPCPRGARTTGPPRVPHGASLTNLSSGAERTWWSTPRPSDDQPVFSPQAGLLRCMGPVEAWQFWVLELQERSGRRRLLLTVLLAGSFRCSCSRQEAVPAVRRETTEHPPELQLR